MLNLSAYQTFMNPSEEQEAKSLESAFQANAMVETPLYIIIKNNTVDFL